MAPAFRQVEICGTFYNISASFCNSSSSDETESENDKHALLYIVCTLLFYSLGIMIGIVSYIKREKRNIEQDRMFYDFLNSFTGQSEVKHYRQLQVQETIERLAEIDRKNDAELDCLDIEKRVSGTKLKGNSRRFYKFVTLSVMQPPLSMKSKSTIKTELKESKKLDDKEIAEVSKEQNNTELCNQSSEVFQDEHHLNGEACNVEAPIEFIQEEEKNIDSTVK